MKRIVEISRKWGPRVIAGMAIDALASGAGTVTGPIVEAVAGLGMDSALSPSAALAGPTINGVKVVPTMTTTHEAQNAWVKASRLTPELCARLDPDLLDGMELARSEPRRATELVDMFHCVDVSDPDYNKWSFTTGGNPTEADTPPDMRVAGIPVPVMREHAQDAYMRVKVTGEPHYLHITRAYGNDGPFAYRCLVDPRFNREGMVVGLHVLVVVESKKLLPVAMRQVEVGR